MISLLAPVLRGQVGHPAGSAALGGVVLDSQNRPAQGAGISLQGKTNSQVRKVVTDAGGAYRFSGLDRGTYTLRAEMKGTGEAQAGPVTLESGETRRVDLKLGTPTASTPATADAPQFFEQPQFTVAGVTETTNSGGHGSDTVLRTTEVLAKATVSLGKQAGEAPRQPVSAEADESFREAALRNPESFDANYQLGKALVAEGKQQEALPYLQMAAQHTPKNSARADAAEVHHLLGDVEEKLGQPLEAVHEYERAAEMAPSEPHLFDWGAELLAHRALEPAAEVFSQGSQLFPQSARMLIGLAVASYSRGAYDQAAKSLIQASDIDPPDLTPYLFMGKMLGVDEVASDDLVERLRRFAEYQPQNALANYYYAVGLRKQRNGASDATTEAQVKALLEIAVHLDPKLASGYLQLGILYAEHEDFPNAIAAYQSAIAASPEMEEPHYRLAQAYRRTGEKQKAQEQLQIYGQLSKQSAAAVERERREIQQFVISLRDGSAPAQVEPKP